MMWRWRMRVNDDRFPLSNFIQEAKNWETCAIGEARERNPKLRVLFAFGTNQDFPSQDRRLQELGLSFFDAVRSNRRAYAKVLLSAIQRRVRRLKERYGV